MKKILFGILTVVLLACTAHAVTCSEATTSAMTLRDELDALNVQFVIDKTTLEAQRDLRVSDVNLTYTQSAIDKAMAKLSYYEGRVVTLNDKLTACQQDSAADCSKKQEAVTKAEARVAKAQEKITKLQDKLAVKQAKIDGYISSYGTKIVDTITKYEALLDAKEADVDTANKTMQDLCGNAGKGK